MTSRPSLTGTLEFRFGTSRFESSLTTEITGAANVDPTTPAPSALTFAGRWQGGYTIQSCQDSGSAFGCKSELAFPTIHEFDVSLTQTGTTIQGVWAFSPRIAVPVAGVLSLNGTLALQGVSAYSDRGRTTTVRLAATTLTRDEVGRLRGTFNYEEITERGNGSSGSTVYEAALGSVALLP